LFCCLLFSGEVVASRISALRIAATYFLLFQQKDIAESLTFR